MSIENVSISLYNFSILVLFAVIFIESILVLFSSVSGRDFNFKFAYFLFILLSICIEHSQSLNIVLCFFVNSRFESAGFLRSVILFPSISRSADITYKSSS